MPDRETGGGEIAREIEFRKATRLARIDAWSPALPGETVCSFCPGRGRSECSASSLRRLEGLEAMVRGEEMLQGSEVESP